MTAEKSYRFSVKWGAETQTDDTEGAITLTSAYLPSKAEITAILPKFTGLIDQVPPDYSAVKIDGKRAYALARSRDNAAGERLEKTPETEVPLLRPRQIRIDALDLLSARPAVQSLRCIVVRAPYPFLARDIGRALNSAAHVTALERRSVGKFM